MIRVSGLHEQLEAALLEHDLRRPVAARAAHAHRPPRARARARSRRSCSSEDLRPGARGAGHPHPRLEEPRRRHAPRGPAVLPALGLPGAHAARRRPGPPVPVPLEPVALARRRGARPRDEGAQLRARQGAREPAALRARARPSSGGAAATAPSAQFEFLPLEQLIAANLDDLFPGMEILGCYPFRVTRDMDIDILEDEAHDLLSIVDREVRRRRFGACVRLEVDVGIPERIRRLLVEKLEIDEEDVYESPAPAGPRARSCRSRRSIAPSCATRRSCSRVPRGARRGRRSLRGDPRRRIACCTTRTTRSRRRARLPAPRRRRSARARHQDDAVPRGLELGDRARARAGGRERQAGRRVDRDQGALRRGEQHRLGAHARARRRARLLRAARPRRRTPR